MKLLVKKIIFAIKSQNLFLRILIFTCSQYQKKIILPINYFFKQNNFVEFDYISGFEKKEKNIINKKIFTNIINFYHYYYNNSKKLKGIWRENIELKFSDLIDALLNKNYKKLNKIFNNIFRNEITDGLCVGYEHYLNSQNLFGKIYIKTVFNNYLQKLKLNKINIHKLKFPKYGNPAGVKLKNNICSIETLRHANQAKTMTNLTSKVLEPTILEIGGGLGGTCFQYIYSFNKNKKIKYYLVDILEVLTMAALFFPKNIVNFNLKKTRHQVFLVPKDNLSSIKNIKFDLVFNSCSLSEMDKSECNKYESFINKCTKKKSFFYHINHDLKINYKSKKNFSTNVLGSEIIAGYNKFNLIEKFKRRNNLPEDKIINYNEYIYQKY